ncbi:MAG: glycine betaine ABC transporter substrate-binding protein [Solirubrobacteraceae bacterium]
MRRSRVVSFVRRLPIVLTVVAALACGACGAGSGPSTTLAGATSTPGTGTGTDTGTSTTPTLPGTGKPTVTIGDKNYTEQFLLGQLYLQALQAQGFTVNLNENIGPTEVTVQALKDGTLAMYPEYLDIFNSAIAGYSRTFRTQLDAYAAADRYALAHGLELLEPTPFSDTDAIAVTDAYAADNELHTIRDLRRIASSLTIGGPPQFQQGPPGLPEIKRAYGVTPAAFTPLAVGDQYDELDAGTVQAADVNTTDGQLASGDYVLLSDPRQIFGFGNVVPVISAKWLAEEGPAFADTIDRVDETLSTATMRELNSEVDIAKLDPASVAKQFLETHGLLTPSPAG